MTGIDELIRETLTAEAETHHVAGDLASRSMTAGRTIRRRRQAGVASLGLASVAGIVAASLAIAGATGGSTPQRVQIGHRGEPKARTSTAPKAQPVPAWSTWPTDRVFGSKPGAAFFGDESPSSVLASGTLADGMEFRVVTGDKQTPLTFWEGNADSTIFGDSPSPGDPVLRPHAPFFSSVVMTAKTWDNGNEDGDGGFWLVVVAQPGTTTASYSPDDGVTWQPMQLDSGIAAIKVPWPNAGTPAAATVRLGNADGTYVQGPVRQGSL